MILRKISTVFFLLCYMLVNGQEFLASVRVNAPTLQIADPKVLTQLKNRVEEFINTHQWTDDLYEPQERIKLNLQITITQDASSSSFRADLGIQATRPVYGSSYESSLISHLDRSVAIEFEAFRPIIATKDVYTDNLSSVLSFYAYFILGLDRDSFSPFGGEKYFKYCREIVNSIPPNVAKDLDPGWAKPSNTETRYYMADNLLNSRMKEFRQGFYDYHRKGLDLMYGNPTEGKLAMTEAIKTVDKLNSAHPNTFIIKIFANTKAAEITKIFKVGTQKERFEMYTIMSRIDPANSSKYEPIRRG